MQSPWSDPRRPYTGAYQSFASLSQALGGTTNSHLPRSVTWNYSTPHSATIPIQRTLANDPTMQGFALLPTTFPLFITVPPRNPRSLLNPRREVRIVALCQGPSVASGMDSSSHVTNHRGYPIKCPFDLEHDHRERVKVLTKVLGYFIKGLEIAGSLFGHPPGRSGYIAVSVLSSIDRTVDNRALLNAAGIDPDRLFEIQVFRDRNQRVAVHELLQRAVASDGQLSITGDLCSLVTEGGRTIWVCNECHDRIWNERALDETSYLTLPQYIPLISIESEAQITLCNAHSVTVLIEGLSRCSKTKDLSIHIEPTYFEAPERESGAPYNAIANLFINLGQAIQRLTRLGHLELHGNSANSRVYDGLNAVFECQSLEVLYVSGISCILQRDDIKMECRKLRKLSLCCVQFDSDESAKNLWELIGKCPNLVWLNLTQVQFSATTLSMDKPRATLTQFGRLETLDLSSNDLGDQEATDLVRMVLASNSPKLKRLDLSGNTRIGNSGYQSYKAGPTHPVKRRNGSNISKPPLRAV
ncbi:hypothetical protein B0O80DRAFT_495021 [Mortierella sp. GBAus27b]|nr:hypothetical protein B0O80DRAFT_495021 [Mortierella sp. GBAus27b]